MGPAASNSVSTMHRTTSKTAHHFLRMSVSVSGRWTRREQRAATLAVFGCGGGRIKVLVAGGAIQLVAARTWGNCRA